MKQESKHSLQLAETICVRAHKDLRDDMIEHVRHSTCKSVSALARAAITRGIPIATKQLKRSMRHPIEVSIPKGSTAQIGTALPYVTDTKVRELAHAYRQPVSHVTMLCLLAGIKEAMASYPVGRTSTKTKGKRMPMQRQSETKHLPFDVGGYLNEEPPMR